MKITKGKCYFAFVLVLQYLHFTIGRMIYSMTGFGAHRQPLLINGKQIALIHMELRSINSRFLDLIFRSPDEARVVESEIRELISKRIHRGKVECRIHIQREEEAHGEIAYSPDSVADRFNRQALDQLKASQDFVRLHFPEAHPLGVKDVLSWPGVMKHDDVETDDLVEAIKHSVNAALDSLVASRQTEGANLATSILDRVKRMEEIVASIEPKLPEIIQIYQDKLTEKLLAVLGGIDQQGRTLSRDEIMDRIRQEVVLYGVRIDVAEEITRLKAHFLAVRGALSKGGPVGKRLDFLMQELQRESNTLGSKSVAQETSDASMELKLMVEQIREQVQNLE